jgi:class 3 adenylate cyclase
LAAQTFTFLFTDIEGSTALLARRGDLYPEILTDHHRLIRASLAAHGGEEVDTQGDAFFVVFSSPSACVAAAIGMQRAFGSHAWPGGEPVRVRMGVHSGEAAEAATGLVGLEIHRAARVAAVGHGGQILVSAATAGLLGDSMPAGASVRDLGVHRLKDLSRPEQIFQLEADGLATVFPPLRSLDNPKLRNNLPAQVSSFIGRDAELGEVQELIASSRLVTLTGPGGAGKTRLGLQLAAGLVDGSGDGVWFADLAPLQDPDLVSVTVANVLGIRGEPGRPALDTLIDAVGRRRLLVLLDNCEHVIGACAKLADALLRTCPNVVLLATSREPLGIEGERVSWVWTIASASASRAAAGLLSRWCWARPSSIARRTSRCCGPSWMSRSSRRRAAASAVTAAMVCARAVSRSRSSPRILRCNADASDSSACPRPVWAARHARVSSGRANSSSRPSTVPKANRSACEAIPRLRAMWD